MARVFVTGSSDGLGLLAARMLVDAGHDVVAHARNAVRAEALRKQLPGVGAVLIADLSDLEATKHLARAVNALGRFDAVIHNAGVYQAERSQIFAVNVVAPYILSALIEPPKRLIYIGSDMHSQGRPDMNALSPEHGVSYSDSKLLVLMLAKALARRWPGVCVNTVDPGWVPTKMGGPGAPDDLEEGARTQVWLATGADASFSGRYLFHMQAASYDSRVDEVRMQEQLLERCHAISGISLLPH